MLAIFLKPLIVPAFSAGTIKGFRNMAKISPFKDDQEKKLSHPTFAYKLSTSCKPASGFASSGKGSGSARIAGQ